MSYMYLSRSSHSATGYTALAKSDIEDGEGETYGGICSSLTDGASLAGSRKSLSNEYRRKCAHRRRATRIFTHGWTIFARSPMLEYLRGAEFINKLY